jgi:hypothetical protein
MAIQVTSSTDSAASVNEAAAAGEGNELVVAATQDPRDANRDAATASPIHVEKVGKGGVASTTDDAAAVHEVTEDLHAEREERKEQYFGRSARKRINALSKRVFERDDRIAELESPLSKYEQPAAQQNGEALPKSNADEQANGSRSEPSSQEQLQQRYEAELHRLKGEVSFPYRQELARARYSDLDETLNGAKTELPLWTIDLLQNAPDGFDVAYYLAKHQDVAQKILDANSQGNPQHAHRILNAISDALRLGLAANNQPASARPQPRTSAPAPIKPVGGGSARSSVDPSEMSYQDFKRWRNSGGGGRK